MSDNIQKMAELFEAMAANQMRIEALLKDGRKVEKAFDKEMEKLKKSDGVNVRNTAFDCYVPSFHDDDYPASKDMLRDAKHLRAFGRLLDKARAKDARVVAQAEKLAERLKKQAKKADKAVKAKTAVKVVAEASAPVVWQQPKVDEAALGT